MNDRCGQRPAFLNTCPHPASYAQHARTHWPLLFSHAVTRAICPARPPVVGKRRGYSTVRIIGGLYRGRNLGFPDLAGLRPTLGRTRETLFNWLTPYIKDARCLDLFAGSGALGFEALSRGAAHATLIDADRSVTQALTDSANALGLDRTQAQVLCTSAAEYLERRPERFDLIFLDPPFADGTLAATLEQIAQRQVLSDEGLIYYEAARDTEFETGALESYRSAQAGGYRYGLLMRSRNG